MRTSVMVSSFSRAISKGALSPAEAVAFCAQAGAQGIEPAAYLEIGDEELRRLIAEHRLALPCYDVRVDLIQDDAAARREATDKLLGLVRRGASLGAAVVLVVPGFLEEGMTFEQASAWAAEGVRAALPVAAELGVTITVEQMGSARALCTRGEHMRAMVEAVDSPHFGLTYDAGNFLLTGEDCVRPLPGLLPWVRHVHFKDWTRQADGAWTGAALGEGVAPLEEIYAVLKAGGYQGYISVEYEGPHDPRAAVQTGIEYIQRLDRSG